ncbi:MAG: KH domain-containing protein [Methanobacteriaceae archaeon]|jgi:ribosomal RNA assembly protein|nr:KH domain-containing protein [Methanobacteriaceae archaeon]
MPNTEYLKIPRERVAVVIGKEGIVKQELEKLTHTQINIESETGSISISPTPEMDDPLSIWKTRNIVRAIGRGFSPEIALKLLDDNYLFDVIRLPDFVGKSKKAMKRQKGRIIGKEGRTREIIKEMTDTDVSVYGKTVSLIGDMEKIMIAKEAIEMILQGIRHKTVYAFLEKKRHEFKLREFQKTVSPE